MRKRKPPRCVARGCRDRKTIRVGLLSFCAAHAATAGIPLSAIGLAFKGARIDVGSTVEAPDPSTGGLEP